MPSSCVHPVCTVLPDNRHADPCLTPFHVTYMPKHQPISMHQHGHSSPRSCTHKGTSCISAGWQCSKEARWRCYGRQKSSACSSAGLANQTALCRWNQTCHTNTLTMPDTCTLKHCMVFLPRFLTRRKLPRCLATGRAELLRGVQAAHTSLHALPGGRAHPGTHGTSASRP